MLTNKALRLNAALQDDSACCNHQLRREPATFRPAARASTTWRPQEHKVADLMDLENFWNNQLSSDQLAKYYKGTYNMHSQTQVNKHLSHKIHKYLYDYRILLLQVQKYHWEEDLQAESN